MGFNFLFFKKAAYLDPKTFKYLSDSEIKDVQSELSAIYPTPRSSRSKNNDCNSNTQNMIKSVNEQINTQNNSKKK